MAVAANNVTTRGRRGRRGRARKKGTGLVRPYPAQQRTAAWSVTRSRWRSAAWGGSRRPAGRPPSWRQLPHVLSYSCEGTGRGAAWPAWRGAASRPSAARRGGVRPGLRCAGRKGPGGVGLGWACTMWQDTPQEVYGVRPGPRRQETWWLETSTPSPSPRSQVPQVGCGDVIAQ